MSSKIKKKSKDFKFTLQNLIRLIIFFGLLYFLISYFSAKENSDYLELNDPTVLGDEITFPSAQPVLKQSFDTIYEKLPEDSRYKIETLNENPAIILFQEKINFIKEQTDGFPEKQIKEIQKAVIKSIYKDLIDNIENN